MHTSRRSMHLLAFFASERLGCLIANRAGGPAPSAKAAPQVQARKAPGGGPPPPPPPLAGSMNKERDGKAQKPAGPGFSAVLSAISNKASSQLCLQAVATCADHMLPVSE